MRRAAPDRLPDTAVTARNRPPAPPAWVRRLALLYVVVLLLIEPVTPVQWPMSFALIAVPLLTAFAHGPYVVAGATVFAVLLEGVLAGPRLTLTES